MVRTIIFLISCLIILPFIAFRYDTPLNAEQNTAFLTAIYAMVGVALTCFIVSELTHNCSQVDKLWSIVPIFYVWFFAYSAHFNTRLVLMAILVTLWGVRLTYNFGRRGGYNIVPWRGEEDYRWSVLRQKPFLNTRGGWAIFNLGFISLYQNALILLFTLPALVAWQGAEKPISVFDLIIVLAFLAFLVIETIADQQQYDFQTEKYRQLTDISSPFSGIYDKGFCTIGLWSKVRHPNYTAEQAIWFTYYFFSVAATGRWINWSLVGGILLILLFIGSSDFSEQISSGKYLEYKDYQKRVPRYLPFKLS